MDFKKTVDSVDIQRFMGDWYVIASRPTFLESGAHNALEIYTWNEEKERIDIDFVFNKDSFDGKKKSIPQKGWIHNQETKAHWKVSPFWPLKFDYLVIALADDYSWTVIGVPNGKYLWLMARTSEMAQEQIDSILKDIEDMGYPIKDVEIIPHG